jgi:hypothetical protein
MRGQVYRTDDRRGNRSGRDSGEPSIGIACRPHRGRADRAGVGSLPRAGMSGPGMSGSRPCPRELHEHCGAGHGDDDRDGDHGQLASPGCCAQLASPRCCVQPTFPGRSSHDCSSRSCSTQDPGSRDPAAAPARHESAPYALRAPQSPCLRRRGERIRHIVTSVRITPNVNYGSAGPRSCRVTGCCRAGAAARKLAGIDLFPACGKLLTS